MTADPDLFPELPNRKPLATAIPLRYWLGMDVADYTITERRDWKRVKPQDQKFAPMTQRKLCAITLAASKQLKQAILDGKATPPSCSFNRGGFDADRLPKRQNRPHA